MCLLISFVLRGGGGIVTLSGQYWAFLQNLDYYISEFSWKRTFSNGTQHLGFHLSLKSFVM